MIFFKKIKIPIRNEVQIVPKVMQAKKDICWIDTCSSNTMVPFKVKKIGVFVIKYFIFILVLYLF